jgi:hypothetical protein
MAGLSAAAAIPFAGWGATGAKVAIKGGRAIEKATLESAGVVGAQGAKIRPDFIANADGTVIPTSRSRLEEGFQNVFPHSPTPGPPARSTRCRMATSSE